VLYLFSRMMIGLASMAADAQGVQPPSTTYPIFAGLVWATIMWLFRTRRSSLQPSLQASMQYLYNDSDRWDSLRNLLWHNK
jgi:peroxisomal membrane protein 4